jgi:hypothetical protein
MRRLHLGLLSGALSMMALSLVLAGCGGGGNESDRPVARKGKGGSSGGSTSGTKAAKKPITAKEFGMITGKIAWSGDKPNLKGLTDELLKLIDQKKEDADYCKKGKPVEVSQYEYRIGDNNNLGNVFVWIEPAEKGYFFEVPEDQRKVKDGVVHQPHCAFMPHCLTLFPVYRGADGKPQKTGQKFIVKNDAKIGHNSKLKGGALNPEQDAQIPPGKEREYTVRVENEPVVISCGIHPWMRAYLRVYEHPWATVSLAPDEASDSKFGTFEIKGVPVGAKVRVLAWHEKCGYLGGPKGQEVTLKKENTIDFKAERP